MTIIRSSNDNNGFLGFHRPTEKNERDTKSNGRRRRFVSLLVTTALILVELSEASAFAPSLVSSSPTKSHQMLRPHRAGGSSMKNLRSGMTLNLATTAEAGDNANIEADEKENLYAAAELAGRSAKSKRIQLPKGVRKYIRKLKNEGRESEAQAYYMAEMEKQQKKSVGKMKKEHTASISRLYSRKRKRHERQK